MRFEQVMISDCILILGDCLEVMPELSVQADMVLADLPYGTTKNHWDIVIPLDQLWEAYKSITKRNAAIVLFGQDKFSARLMLSNEKWHRYNLIWRKTGQPTGFLNANRMPLREHEDILVFYQKLPTYNPQFWEGKPSHSMGQVSKNHAQNCYGEFDYSKTKALRGGNTQKHPRSVLEFKQPHPAIYPTQKPVQQCEWLIRTYTNPGELVLDNTMGSGTTGIACVQTGRRFIGIEKDRRAFELACERITAASLNNNSAF